MTDQVSEAIVPPEIPVGVPFARTVSFLAPPAPPPLGYEFLLLDQSRRSAWADLGWFVPAMIVLELFIEGMLHFILRYVYGFPVGATEVETAGLQRTMLLPSLSLRAGGVFVLIAVLVHRHRQGAAAVGLRRSGRLADIGLGVAALVLTYGFVFAAMLSLWLVWPEIAKQMNENADRIMDLVPNLGPLGFLVITTIIGLYEELVFRGFLMPRLRRATGSWTAAIVLSTIVFTALHALEQTLAALIMVTLLSLIFSFLTIWRRSILPAIVAHFLFDFSQFLGLYFQAGEAWK